MPIALRTIRKGRWFKPDWMGVGEARADVLDDLKTLDDKLSIWLIDGDRGNLKRVIAAIASNRDNVMNVDYALLDYGVIEQLNWVIEKNPGISADKEANRLYHVDLAQLTAAKLGRLAGIISNQAWRFRLQEWEVGKYLDKAIAGGNVDPSKFTSSSLLPNLERKRHKWQGR